MASLTRITRRRRKAKRTKLGQRRKREIRKEVRRRILELAQRLGLTQAKGLEKPSQATG